MPASYEEGSTDRDLIELFTLLMIVIAVQTVYATVIRPRAEAIRAADLITRDGKIAV